MTPHDATQVLLNPPFTAAVQWRFVNRAIDEVENDSVPCVLLVCRNSTDTGARVCVMCVCVWVCLCVPCVLLVCRNSTDTGARAHARARACAICLRSADLLQQPGIVVVMS